MEGSNELSALVSVLTSSDLWQAVVVFIVGFILISILKSVARTIFQYILFKTDVFGIGSYVDYKGTRGVIKEMGLRRITIKLEDRKSTMYIHTTDWKNLILIVSNDIKFKKD